MNIPDDFKEYADLIRAASYLSNTNPTISAVLQNCFKDTIQDMADAVPLSPQAQQFLQSYIASCPPMPPNGISQLQQFANNYFNQLSAEIGQGNFRMGQIKDFQICHSLFRILDGDDNLVKSKKCMQVAIKIKKMFEKGMKGKQNNFGNSQGAPPSFSQSGGSPPSFDPYGSSAGGPPTFTPGSTGGPPAFTPGSTGGPPAFTPGSAGGPPTFTPGSTGGPPTFTPGSTGGPPTFTPEVPSSSPTFNQDSSQSTTLQSFSIPVDSTFDIHSATQLIQSLGYKMEDPSKYPPLNQQTYFAIEGFLDYAVRGIQDSDKESCLSFLQEALKTWESGALL